MSYIHLNPNSLVSPGPARSDLAGGLENYSYSSYADYAGIYRPEGVLLTKDALPLYFPTPDDFKKEIKEWLQYRDQLSQ